jgi:triacylglycerol lipase
MRHPIILAHGIARFDVLLRPDNLPALDSLDYWRNVRTWLTAAGYEVHHTDVDWAGPVVKRARQLAEQIVDYVNRRPGGPTKVHIVAHSMGGLDSRWAIARCGLGPQVASLTTLGTPHHGTSFADWGMETELTQSVSYVLRLLGIDSGGLRDLTTRACRERNRELADFEARNHDGIRYQSYAGVQTAENIFWLLRYPYELILRRQGPNDGLVPASSARWNDQAFQGTLNYDHLNMIGWWDPAELELFGGGKDPVAFEAEIRRFYLGLAHKLDALPA